MAIAMALSADFTKEVGFDSVSELREWINEVTAGSRLRTRLPTVAKELPIRILNMEADGIFSWLLSFDTRFGRLFLFDTCLGRELLFDTCFWSAISI